MQIVRSGRWLYDDQVEQPVDIIALDYDYWFEFGKADGQLQPGETPMPFGPEGLLYYVRFGSAGSRDEPTRVDSGGHQTIDEAAQQAQSRVPSRISWWS